MKVQTIDYVDSKAAIEKFPEDYYTSYYLRMGIDCGYEEYIKGKERSIIKPGLERIKKLLLKLEGMGFELMGFSRLYFDSNVDWQSYEVAIVLQFDYDGTWAHMKEFREFFDNGDNWQEYIYDGLIEGECPQDLRIQGLDSIQVYINESY